MSNWPSWLPLRSELKSTSPYGAPQIEGVTPLNTNENPYSLPAEVTEAILDSLSQKLSALNRYPDRDATVLREKLAGYINGLSQSNFSGENIWVANGSNEILQTLFLAFGGAGRRALGFTPSYSVHPLIAASTGTPWIVGSRDGQFELDAQSAVAGIRELRPQLVFLTTPNNPSGTVTPLRAVEELAQAAGEVGAIFVVDEAYAEFSTEISAVTLIRKFPHLVVVRTMSKAFAFAGARVGYLVANPSAIDAMLVVRLPYHLSVLTQAAAEVAVDCAHLLQADIAVLITERERVAVGIRSAGWQPLPSAANFILFSGFTQESSSLWQAFLDRGILIRDVGLKGYLRVTIGTPEQNDQFIAALNELAQ